MILENFFCLLSKSILGHLISRLEQVRTFPRDERIYHFYVDLGLQMPTWNQNVEEAAKNSY